MGKNLDLFIDDVSQFLFEQGLPFIRWEINLGNIELIVYDKYENKVKEVWNRSMIEQEYSHKMSEYVSYMIYQKFVNKMYYQEKYYTRW